MESSVNEVFGNSPPSFDLALCTQIHFSPSFLVLKMLANHFSVSPLLVNPTSATVSLEIYIFFIFRGIARESVTCLDSPSRKRPPRQLTTSLVSSKGSKPLS